MKNRDQKIGWISYFSLSLLVVLIASLWQGKGLAIVIANLCGIIFFFLIGKHKKEAFFFGILQVLIMSIVLMIQNNLSSALYNLLYCLPMYSYGYLYWRKKEKQKEKNILMLSNKARLLGLGIVIVIISMYVTVVKLIGGSFALFDSIAVIFGFVSVFFIANRYIESWIAYLILYSSNVIMWLILTIQNIQNLPLLLITLTYLIYAVYAFIKWKK